METDVKNYKCPACGGSLHYDGKENKLVCDYCGSDFDLSRFEDVKPAGENSTETGAAEDKFSEAENSRDWENRETSTDWGVDNDSLRVYTCPSCGAELICDETTAATSCPYCGNPAIMPEKFEGVQRPDYVLPFKLTKEEAVEALTKHYNGKIFLPKTFKDKNHIEEIKGVYVPFWLFDMDVDGEMRYAGANTRSYRDGDYLVTETDHYNIYRSGSMRFEKIPADGSSKMPDDYMDSIEPFDYSALEEFSPSYLPGFMADKYDVDAAKVFDRAEQRCTQTVKDEFRRTVIGYEEVHSMGQYISLKDSDVHYALMPVWLLSTKWNDKNYLFAMNGQTGKLVGNLPMDKGSFWKWFWGLTAGVGAVLSLFLSGPLGRWLMDFFM